MMELRHKARYFFNTVCWLTGNMKLDKLLIITCSIQTCFATFLWQITSNKSEFRHVNFTSCGPSSWWRWKQFLLFPVRPTTKPSRQGFSLLYRHCRGSASINEATDVCSAGPGFSPFSLLPSSEAMTLHQRLDKPVNSSQQRQPSTKHLTWLQWSRVSRDPFSWACRDMYPRKKHK